MDLVLFSLKVEHQNQKERIVVIYDLVVDFDSDRFIDIGSIRYY